jgi:hypothetical protein
VHYALIPFNGREHATRSSAQGVIVAKVYKVCGIMPPDLETAEWPWPKCVAVFELDEASGTEDRPRFGEIDTTPFATHIVIHVRGPEATQHRVRAGYYASPIPIHEAEKRLDACLL